MSELFLDERILWWVVLPIIYVTALINMAGHFYSSYSASSSVPKPIKSRQALVDMKDKQLIAKCDMLISRSHLLSGHSFEGRRSYLCRGQRAYLKVEGERPPPDPASNPMAMQSGMMDMMKGNLTMMLQTMPAMGWISTFFSGFVLTKVPFSLTQKFRSMTQYGIEIQNLDVSYVSGLSFYFLIMMGVGQLNSLLLYDPEESEMQFSSLGKMSSMMMPGMGPGMGAGANPLAAMMGTPQAPIKDMFKPQLDAIQLSQHTPILEEFTQTALAKLNALQIN